jgi:hypothetical protein
MEATMASIFPRSASAFFAVPVAAAAFAAACSGGSSNNSSAATGTGTMTGTGGSTGTGGTASTGGAGTGGGTSGPTMLTLPQFVHGAAYVDTLLFPTIPVVVAFTGTAPASLEVSIDGTVTAAMPDNGRFVANVSMTLAAGPHMLVATAKTGGMPVATVKGSLVAGAGSLEFTTVAKDGLAELGHVGHDVAGDTLLYTWVSDPTGSKHQLFFNRLDGAFARLMASDVVLNDPNDEPLSGYTAFGPSGIGVVYRTPKPNDAHWLVKLRVVDPMGAELVPAMDLTQGQAAFENQAAGFDPGGFSAAWLHISPPASPPPPVEIRFARWDLAAKKLVGPITLDSDQPAVDMTQGPQILEPTSELSMACNTTICLVSYVRDVYSAALLLNVAKVFLATIDIASGALVGKPAPVAGGGFDLQQWGDHLVALDDGSFVLAYQANDASGYNNGTVGICKPGDPPCCDPNQERDLIWAVKIDATGKLVGAPKTVVDAVMDREYPRIAPHPEGFALFWEDQRSECPMSGGHIRMAGNVVAPDLSKLLDPYLEMPGSIALPPEYPTLAVTGTNFVSGWSDNRHGNGLLDIQTESYFETYWRK